MNRSLPDHHLAYSKNWGWFLLWGVALMGLGIAAVGASVFTTLLSVVFIGVLLVISGVVIMLDSFSFWRTNKTSGFMLHLLMGILYLLVGLWLIKSPVAGSISITLLLGMLYIVVGAVRVIYSLALRMSRWGWSLFSGLVTLLLGILIVANWPVSGLFIIGLFVGIDLIFIGWVYIVGAIASRSLTKAA
jgi:uncharacterized membrane protein HdeD (DUF308 family)